MSRLDQPWDEAVDRISDDDLRKLANRARQLKPFTLGENMTCRQGSVTATLRYEDTPGLEGQADALRWTLSLACTVEALVNNLLHERGL